MKKPGPKKPSDLQHPKGTYKAWNGDARRRGSNRWNGAADMEDRGFATRGLVRVTHATESPKPWDVKPHKTVGAVKPPANGGRVGYTRPIALDSDANKILRGHTPSLNRWCSLLADGVPVPLEVAAALRYVDAYDIYSLYGD